MKQKREIFEVVPVVATTLDDAWFQLLVASVEYGFTYLIDQGSYEGQYRLQIPNLNLVVKFPWMEPRLPMMPEGSTLPPPVDEQYLADYLPYLLSADKKPNEIYTYGEFANFWKYYILEERKTKKGKIVKKVVKKFINQVEIVTQMIANNPGNNQSVISVCNPESLIFEDPPCLRQIQLQVINGQLYFILFWRSWDLCNGAPGNLAAIQVLKEVILMNINEIRQSLGLKEFEDGPIISHTSGGHIYDHVFDLVEQRLMLEHGSIKKTHGLV